MADYMRYLMCLLQQTGAPLWSNTLEKVVKNQNSKGEQAIKEFLAY